MSILNDPLEVLTRATSVSLYVMVFDPRDLACVYYRSGAGIGRVTSRDSLPPEVRDFFERESNRIAGEWTAMHYDDEQPATREEE